MITASSLRVLASIAFEVAARQLGENMTTQGIDLLGLPRGTLLHVGASAVVSITGLRNPCSQLNQFQQGLMMALIDRDSDGALVRKAGVMAVAITGGTIQPDDPIVMTLPPLPHERLDRV